MMNRFVKKLASYILVPLALLIPRIANSNENRFTNITSKLEQAVEKAGHDLYNFKAVGIGGSMDLDLEGRRGGHGVIPTRIKNIGNGFQILVTNNGPFDDDLFFVHQGNFNFTEEANERGLLDEVKRQGGTHGGSWNGRILVKGKTYEKEDNAYLFNPQTDRFERIFDFGFTVEGENTKTRSIALLADLSGNGLYGVYAGRHQDNQLYQPVDLNHVVLKNSLWGEATQGVSAVRTGNTWRIHAADIEEGNRIIEIDAAWNPSDITKIVGIEKTKKVDGGFWADWNGDAIFDLIVTGNESETEFYFGKPDGTYQNLTDHFKNKYGIEGGEYMPVVDELDNKPGLDLVLGDRIWFQVGKEIVDGVSVPILDGPYSVGVQDQDLRGVAAITLRPGIRDLVYARKWGVPALIQNNTPVGYNWLDISVVDQHGGIGIGADVLVYNPDNPEEKQLFQIMSANGYCAQPDSVIHYVGTPGNRYEIKVTLPGGLERIIKKVNLGQKLVINFN